MKPALWHVGRMSLSLCPPIASSWWCVFTECLFPLFFFFFCPLVCCDASSPEFPSVPAMSNLVIWANQLLVLPPRRSAWRLKGTSSILICTVEIWRPEGIWLDCHCSYWSSDYLFIFLIKKGIIFIENGMPSLDFIGQHGLIFNFWHVKGVLKILFANDLCVFMQMILTRYLISCCLLYFIYALLMLNISPFVVQVGCCGICYMYWAISLECRTWSLALRCDLMALRDTPASSRARMSLMALWDTHGAGLHGSSNKFL
jgi:hypothetical protein